MATTLNPVDPIACNRELTFTLFNRMIAQLMARDRELERAVVNFTNESELQRTAELLGAFESLLGAELVQSTIDNDVIPAGFESYDQYQSNTNDRLDVVETAVVFEDTDGARRSIKSLALNNEASISALNEKVDALDAELDTIRELTDDIETINTTLQSQESRLADVETLLQDVVTEVKNARKEFADDPSKRLIDKISDIDARILSNVQNVRSLIKEVTDARSSDRFDTLGGRIGALESGIEELFDTIASLRGRGTVTGMKVGRSILHGDVELIPGENIAITRERNGYRIDVVDKGTCVNLGAPIVDPNDGCCPPSNANFGN